MTNHDKNQLVAILRKIGSEHCLEKARLLEADSLAIHSLHLRSLDLNAENVTEIAKCLSDDHELKSISFSYNTLLGDIGAMALAKNLPNQLKELGLVNCGISDVGGIELLKWMKTATQLQMICMEQNHFSESLKAAFRNFGNNNAQVLVIV